MSKKKKNALRERERERWRTQNTHFQIVLTQNSVIKT